jgi:hypothetical protein
MHDDKTTHLALPLPHPANTLELDVFRLRTALAQLDSHLHGIDAILHTEDVDLDTVAEIIEAVKNAHADIAALNTLIDTEIAEKLADVRAEIENLRPLVYAGL